MRRRQIDSACQQGGGSMSQVMPEIPARTEVRDGMRITWQQPIPMDDGIVLRADVFAPIEAGSYPVILSYGIYAKGLAYQEGYPHQWRKMVEDHPEILEGSSNKYQNWEVTDPERWIPHGYVVVRVDSRGAGWSPGLMDPSSEREFQKLWARHQVVDIQHGRGERARKNPNTGESVAGPVTLSEEELARNRVDVFEELKKHPLDDAWHHERSA